MSKASRELFEQITAGKQPSLAETIAAALFSGHAHDMHSQSSIVHGPDRDHNQAQLSPWNVAQGNGDGQMLTPGKPPDMGWAEWIEHQQKGNQDGNGGSDQSDRGKGRSLPDEQKKEQIQDQDRSRGR